MYLSLGSNQKTHKLLLIITQNFLHITNFGAYFERHKSLEKQ